MPYHLTRGAETVLRAAADEARRRNASGIDDLHLLLAMLDLDGGNNIVVGALYNCGVTREVVENCIRERSDGGTKRLEIDWETEAASNPYLTAAFEEAGALGHWYSGPEHLFLALLRDSNGSASHLFDSKGVDRSILRSRTLCILGNERWTKETLHPWGKPPGRADSHKVP